MLENGNDAGNLDDSAVTEMAVRKHLGFEPCETPSLAEPGQFSKSDLLARLSHEMRTPLSAILGFAQLMESGTPSPTVSQQRRIYLILQAGWYLEKLIKMAHDLALIESGKLSLSVDAVPLDSVMLDCRAMIESKAQMRGVRVSFPLLDTPCFVSADRNRLQQVLGNLLSAAIEYSELDGTVIVGCETGSSEWIRIGINDGGNELAAERVPRIVQPIDGVEQEAPALEGAGIGLLLAQRLVELMGGAIAAGSGRVFSFDIKRVSIPMAASRDSIDPAGDQASLSVACVPQGTIGSPDNHAHQAP